MDHREAMEGMVSERYLLGELSPKEREAYEDHLFECLECAGDAMLGATFVDRAKAVLLTMPILEATEPIAIHPEPREAKRDWFAWLRPAVMVPIFASLVAVIAYQNLVTVPALETAANEPQVLPVATVLHGDTRSGVPVVHADLIRGSVLEVESPGGPGYVSYKLDFYSAANKLIFTRLVPASVPAQDTQAVFLPGRMKAELYRLALAGVTPAGEIVPLSQQFFDLQVKK